MRRVLKTQSFSRWMRKTELTDASLCTAVSEMEAGLIDADLGGGILKKRVGLPGRGKRGGVRTLIATNKGDRWFFVFGFEKAERSNIDAREETALKLLAEDLLKLTAKALDELVKNQQFEEICHGLENEG